MRNLEIELKHYAQYITIADFKKTWLKSKPVKVAEFFGWDYFYSSEIYPDTFWRHRVGSDTNQLTFKRKLDFVSNYVRTEANLDISDTKGKVEGFLESLGYTYNTRIFKHCVVAEHPYCIVSYYVCYDSNLSELGRFIEIEAREDVEWGSDKEAFDFIVTIEKTFHTLGLSESTRCQRSLFELYRK